MNLPEINRSSLAPITISAFEGLEKNKNRVSEKQFSHIVNMTSDYYPGLGNRKKRTTVLSGIGQILGVEVTAEDIYYVAIGEDNKAHLYCNGNLVTKTTTENGEEKTEEIVTMLSTVGKKMVMMGAYLVIYPDNVKYNTHDQSVEEFGFSYIFHPLTSTAGTYQYYMCLEDGVLLKRTIKSVEQATNGEAPGTEAYSYYTTSELVAKKYAELGEYTVYWLNINEAIGAYSLKLYYPELDKWAVQDVYCCIDIYDENMELYNFGRIVSYYKDECLELIAGSDNEELKEIFNGTKKIKNVIFYDNQIKVVLENISIWKHVFLNGNHDQDTTMNFSTLSIKNTPPFMDYVVCIGNRIWGCSSEKHEIYASKLGDPANFISFNNISLDSYTVTIGSTGDFTGAAVYGDYPVFFKEDRIITFYGSRPANYQLSEVLCEGMEPGADKTVAYLDEYLYYKSRRGIMRFDGNYPVLISEELGSVPFYGGIAAALKDKYYIQTKEKNDTEHLFVYDTKKNIWMEENILESQFLKSVRGNLYGIGSEIIYVTGTNDEKLKEDFDIQQESEIDWECITGDILNSATDKTIINKLLLTFELGSKSRIEICIRYDNEEVWKPIFTKASTKQNTYNIPIIPKRCDRIHLKLKGKGEFRLYQITKMMKKAGRV